MRAVDLGQVTDAVAKAFKPVNVLWQTEDSLAFVARGREHRSEFHVDPSDEVMFMIKGDMQLHYRTPEGEEKIATIRQGEILHCPAGTPHSPRFARDAYVLVIERKRRAHEDDRFLWYCAKCGAQLHEAIQHVADWRADPVTAVYEDFYNTEAHRTCGKCGHVTPRPQ